MKDLHCSSVPVMMDVVAVDDRWTWERLGWWC
jgi:hypothetical protein